MRNFIVGRIKSFKYAFRGMYLLLTSELNIITQFIGLCLFVILGFYFSITRVEWMIQIAIFGVVLGLEGINTAIEKLSDFVHPDYHSKICNIKDIAAGAVNFVAMATFVILIIIYYPYVTNLFL